MIHINPPDLIANAHYEAGHAIAFIRFGIDLPKYSWMKKGEHKPCFGIL